MTFLKVKLNSCDLKITIPNMWTLGPWDLGAWGPPPSHYIFLLPTHPRKSSQNLILNHFNSSLTPPTFSQNLLPTQVTFKFKLQAPGSGL